VLLDLPIPAVEVTVVQLRICDHCGKFVTPKNCRYCDACLHHMAVGLLERIDAESSRPRQLEPAADSPTELRLI
jgi:hypothetical protein